MKTPHAHLHLAAQPERLAHGDAALLARCSELHAILNQATEELREALMSREAAPCAASSRRLYSIGILFGEAVRKHGSL